MELSNIKHRIDMWRFYEELERIKKKEPCENCTLFYGSSTFAHYVNIENDFKEYNARNSGFGGSTSDEALFHYESIVNKFNPTTLVWYFGDNEPVCGYTLKETKILFEAVFNKYHSDYPDGLIIIVGTKSSYARKEYFDYVRKLNKWEKELSKKYSYIEYVDTSDIWYKDNDYDYSNFCDDKLHFNDKGNSLFAARIKKIIDSHRKLDIEKVDLIEEPSKLLKSTLIEVISVSVLTLAVLIISLFTSGPDYTLNLVLNIILSILLVIYLVSSIRVRIYGIKKELLLRQKMTNSDVSREILIYKGKRINYLLEGTIVDVLKFETVEGKERDIYCLSSYPLYLLKNHKYEITSAANTILKVKEDA